MAIVLNWTLIPTQLNALINSVIYLARNRDIKKYYCNVFNCGKADNKIQITAFLARDVRENPQKQKNVSSL